MAKPNYAFEKRQRDLAKQRKKEEKRQKKAGKPDAAAVDTTEQDAEAGPEPQASDPASE